MLYAYLDEDDGPEWYKEGEEEFEWAAAENFANYWGVNYEYNTHYEFSLYVKKGDFICLDKDGDGRWNHFGFVTAKSGTWCQSNEGVYYKDYKVAQHTSNYHLWVSNDKRKWEENNNGAIFGIVRFDYATTSW